MTHTRHGWARTATLVALAALTLAAGRDPGSGVGAIDDAPESPVLETRNVFLVTVDGLRWQEVFSGFAAELNTKEDGGVAAFASWDAFPYILAQERSGLTVSTVGPPLADPRSDRERLLNAFAGDLPAYLDGARFDDRRAAARGGFRRRRARGSATARRPDTLDGPLEAGGATSGVTRDAPRVTLGPAPRGP